MKSIFKSGDQKVYRRRVEDSDLAAFQGVVLHPVCSTFALARDFEWSSRLFFLEMKEDDEEGVGTQVHVRHLSPAFAGEEIIFTATVEKIEGMTLTCTIEAMVNNRLIATGVTGQKMLKKSEIDKIFLSNSRPPQ